MTITGSHATTDERRADVLHAIGLCQYEIDSPNASTADRLDAGVESMRAALAWCDGESPWSVSVVRGAVEVEHAHEGVGYARLTPSDAVILAGRLVDADSCEAPEIVNEAPWAREGW